MTQTEYQILVVDSDESLARELDKVLAGPSFIVSCVSNASQAVTRLKGEPIDAMILDLVLPNGAGEGLVRTFATAYPDMPIVVITDLKDFDRSKIMGAGAKELLPKPLDLRKLDDGFPHVANVLFRVIAANQSAMKSRVIHEAFDSINKIVTDSYSKMMRIAAKRDAAVNKLDQYAEQCSKSGCQLRAAAMVAKTEGK